MKKELLKIVVVSVICAISLNAKTVTVHEAVETLNKTTGMLVDDYSSLSKKFEVLENRIKMIEQSKVTIVDKSKEEIEIDNKILQYIAK